MVLSAILHDTVSAEFTLVISLGLHYIICLCCVSPSAEAVVVVRESAARAVSEVLDRFHSSGGVRMRFSVAEIPDQEDWGTADSLRAIKTRVKVGEIIACTNMCVGSCEKYRKVAFGTVYLVLFPVSHA